MDGLPRREPGRWTSSTIMDWELKKDIAFYVVWGSIFPCLLVWIYLISEGARRQTGVVVFSIGIIVQVVLSILFYKTKRFYRRILEGFIFLETREEYGDISRIIERGLESLGIPFTILTGTGGVADYDVPKPLRKILYQYHIPVYDLDIIARWYGYSKGKPISRIFLGPISGTPDDDIKGLMLMLEDGFL